MQSTLCGGMTSSKWKVFESLLFLGLFLFFVSRVATSVEKLRAAKVENLSKHIEGKCETSAIRCRQRQ